MSAPARIPQGTPVTLSGITKKYGNRAVLNDINLRIPPGSSWRWLAAAAAEKVRYYACSPVWKKPRRVNFSAPGPRSVRCVTIRG